MPLCSNCDGDDFDVVNGLYFCTICQTQSQDIVQFDETTSFSQQQTEQVECAGSSQTAKPVKSAVGEVVRRRCDLGKEIKPVSTMQIVEMILDKLLQEYSLSLSESKRQQMMDLSSRIMTAYASWIESTRGSADNLSQYFTLRDFFYLKYPDKFYLLYIYDLWKYVTEREIYKAKRKRKRAKAAKRKTEGDVKSDLEENGQEATSFDDFGIDASVFLEDLLNGGDNSQDCDPAKLSSWSVAPEVDEDSIANCESLDVEEFESDSEVIEEGRKLSSEMFEEQEHKILLEASQWTKATHKKCKELNYIARPSHRMAYSILYLVAIMRNESVFLEDLLYKIYCNAVPLLDLVSWFPEVVLTPHEVTVNVNVDFVDFIRLIRNSAHRLYRVLFTTMESVALSDIELNSNDTQVKCQWVLDKLNLPRSLAVQAANLMDQFRNKIVATKFRQPNSILPECFFDYDVYFFVAVFVVKHVVVDSARHDQLRALSRKWYKWAHDVLFDSAFPRHLLIFVKQPTLMGDKVVHMYPEAVNRIQTLVMRNRFHYYRRFGLPGRVRKKLALWEMANHTHNPEQLFEDYALFLDKKVERILRLAEPSFRRDFEREPPLNEVVIKLNDSYVFALIMKKCAEAGPYRTEINLSLSNEKRMNVAVANSKLENRFWDPSPLPEGHSALRLSSDPSMDRETQMGKLEERFRAAMSKEVEEKEGVDAFGIYDQLFFILAAVSGDKFRACTTNFLLMLGSD